MNKILKNRNVKIWLICLLVIGLLPLAWKGLSFGMDFTGGTSIKVKLVAKPGEEINIQTVTTILQTRLNILGLKDVAVKPWGKDYIVVDIAETDPDKVNRIQALLSQRGRFEALFDGKMILAGEDIIQVLTDPQQGFGVQDLKTTFEWVVPFLLSNDGSQKFADAVAGRCTQIQQERCSEVIYMFMDRPDNAVILMDAKTSEAEKEIPEDLETAQTLITLEELVKNSGAELVVSNSLDEQTLLKIANKTVVILPDTFNKTLLEQKALIVLEKPKIKKYWIQSALGLESIIHLTPGVTSGERVTKPSITGYAETPEKASQEMQRIAILLKAGKLPVSTSVGSVSTISPTLGPNFLANSGYAGLLAILAVGGVIFVRYRKIKIVVPVMVTAISEVVLILGIASLIGWQIDLPAVAGLVAAVGTGVDHQIIITDEILMGRREELGLGSRIKKAFGIIFMAASTVIFAMFPLFFLGLGALKGFAIVTILGALSGVFIARPAFAAIVEHLLSSEEKTRLA